MSCTCGRSVCWRESEELAHKVRSAVGVLLDLLNIGKGWIPGFVTQQQQITKADNGREQIIKVMGNAARELSDRLHFLRLDKLAFEIFLLAQINK